MINHPNANEHITYSKLVWRRYKRHKLAVVSSWVLGIMVLMAIFAPIISPYNPDALVGRVTSAPSSEHWLGTDQSGRDVLSRLLHGMRISLLVGFLSTGISLAIGVTLGLLAGYIGGWIDTLIMRICDMIMSFPYLLLVLVAAAIFRPGMWTIIIILGLVDWPGVARLIRGNVLNLREQAFVKGSQVAGMPRRYILWSDILPNTVAPILIYATNVMAAAILDEAALSFLGMGVMPPTASLGNMLNGAESLTILTRMPWLWIPPGLVIIILVVAINFIGDALRDAANPN